MSHDLLDPPNNRPNHTVTGKPRRTAWQVRVPTRRGLPSGFYGEGYTIPDLFTTKADAVGYIERNGSISSAHPVEVPVSEATAKALAADDG